MKKYMDYSDKLYALWKRLRLFEEADRVVIGVSGGSDSVFLIHALNDFRKKVRAGHARPLPMLTAAHFNHRLRGEDSDQDEAFTVSLCEKLRVPVVTGAWQREPNGREKPSEEEARNARYAFFEKVCREAGANKLALAHTADDDAETILFRFLRGSGLSGLRGIPYERALGSFRIIRPLKEFSKQAIQDYLRKNKIPWREDSSNKDLTFRRNKIRHLLLPLLEKEFNPKIRETLVRFGKNLSEDYEYLKEEAEKPFREALLTEKSGGIVFKRKSFMKFPTAIQKMLFREVFRRLRVSMDEVGYADWEMASRFLERKSFQITLSGSVILKATPTKLSFLTPLPQKGNSSILGRLS